MDSARIATRYMEAISKPGDVHVPVDALMWTWGAKEAIPREVVLRPAPGGRQVVVIDDTPGHWYLEDFLNESPTDRLGIDANDNWYLTNLQEVQTAIRKAVGDDESLSQGGLGQVLDLIPLVRQLQRALEGTSQPRQKQHLVNLLYALQPQVTALFGEADGQAYNMALRRLKPMGNR